MSKLSIMKPEQEAYFSEAAKAIKSSVGIPVILVGGLRSFEIMEKVVKEGTTDMVSLCRPLIREPDLITKFASGQTQKATCVSCNACFNSAGLKCWLDQ